MVTLSVITSSNLEHLGNPLSKEMKKKTNLTNHKAKHLIYPSDLLGAIDVTESSSPP